MSQEDYTSIIGLLSNHTKKIVSETITKQGIDIHVGNENGNYHWLQSIANWVNNSCWEYDESEQIWYLNDGFDNIIQISEKLTVKDWLTKDKSQIKTITLRTAENDEKTFFLMYT